MRGDGLAVVVVVRDLRRFVGDRLAALAVVGEMGGLVAFRRRVVGS
jgi:hypothetical protein